MNYGFAQGCVECVFKTAVECIFGDGLNVMPEDSKVVYGEAVDSWAGTTLHDFEKCVCEFFCGEQAFHVQ